jgi:hypothetical protein
VGLVIAWLPVAAAFTTGDTTLLALTIFVALAITGYTFYRIVDRGYLPLAEPIARITGLHDTIGPGSRPEGTPRSGRRVDAAESQDTDRETDRSNERS